MPVLLVGSSLLVLASFLFYRNFLKRYFVSASGTTERVLEERDLYTVLLASRTNENIITKAKLVVVQRKEEKIYTFEIPSDQLIDMPGKLGEETLGKAYVLGNMYGEGGGEKLLVSAYEKISKTKIHRFMLTNTDTYENLNSMIFDGSITSLMPWTISSYYSKTATSFTLPEFLNFVYYAHKIDATRITAKQFSSPETLWGDISQVYLNSQNSLESKNIVVLNGSGTPEIGKYAGDVITNLGGRVVLIANAKNVYNKTFIITDDAASFTAESIKSYFTEADFMTMGEAGRLDEDVLDRGDVILIVGFDTSEYL